MNVLEAVRVGRWKLHLAGDEPTMLFDLDTDVGETTDVAADRADVVAELSSVASVCRLDLGHASEPFTRGRGCRPAGRVSRPVTLLPHKATSNAVLRSAYD